MDNREKAFSELVADDKFVVALREANSKDDIKRIFGSFGFDVTNEEVDAFVSSAEEELAGAELAESDLEVVAGGAGIKPEKVLEWMWNGAKAVAKKAWGIGKKFANWEDKLYSRK